MTTHFLWLLENHPNVAAWIEIRCRSRQLPIMSLAIAATLVRRRRRHLPETPFKTSAAALPEDVGLVTSYPLGIEARAKALQTLEAGGVITREAQEPIVQEDGSLKHRPMVIRFSPELVEVLRGEPAIIAAGEETGRLAEKIAALEAARAAKKAEVLVETPEAASERAAAKKLKRKQARANKNAKLRAAQERFDVLASVNRELKEKVKAYEARIAELELPVVPATSDRKAPVVVVKRSRTFQGPMR